MKSILLEQLDYWKKELKSRKENKSSEWKIELAQRKINAISKDLNK
tara:strand:+ start:545 stop:682 length:138 start_codon:yes stop_codon:yes gene_type:complete